MHTDWSQFHNSLIVFYVKNFSAIINPCPAEPGYTLPLQTEEANWSGSALFSIKYVNSYQQYEESNLIG